MAGQQARPGILKPAQAKTGRLAEQRWLRRRLWVRLATWTFFIMFRTCALTVLSCKLIMHK